MDGLTYVDEVTPTAVVTASWLGRSVPLHATSTGKALLAFLPPSRCGECCAGPLPAFTGHHDHRSRGVGRGAGRDPGPRVRGVRRGAGVLAVRGLRAGARPGRAAARGAEHLGAEGPGARGAVRRAGRRGAGRGRRGRAWRRRSGRRVSPRWAGARRRRWPELARGIGIARLRRRRPIRTRSSPRPADRRGVAAATSGCERNQPLRALSPNRGSSALCSVSVTPGASAASSGVSGTGCSVASSRGEKKIPMDCRVRPGGQGNTRCTVDDQVAVGGDLEHLPDVDHQGVRPRRDVHPLRGRAAAAPADRRCRPAAAGSGSPSPRAGRRPGRPGRRRRSRRSGSSLPNQCGCSANAAPKWSSAAPARRRWPRSARSRPGRAARPGQHDGAQLGQLPVRPLVRALQQPERRVPCGSRHGRPLGRESPAARGRPVGRR